MVHHISNIMKLTAKCPKFPTLINNPLITNSIIHYQIKQELILVYNLITRLCNPKRRGPQSNRTLWQDTYSDRAQISKISRLNRSPWSSLSLRLSSRLNLYAHLDIQTYIVCILETFTAPIMEFRT